MNQRGNGFTLVETMSAIAVVLVLAAIVLPVMSRARTSAWQTVTATNLKQIAYAQLLYAGENNGSFATSGSRFPAAWTDQLLPYLNPTPVAPQCSYSRASISDEPGYAINGCLNRRESLIDEPPAVVLATEVAKFRLGPNGTLSALTILATDETMLKYWRDTVSPAVYPDGPLRVRYYRGGNLYAHVDGSVAFARKEQVDTGLPIACYEAKTRTRWRFALQGESK